MTEEQVPQAPITSPLQLLALPFTLLQQSQLQMTMHTIRAMGGGTAEEKRIETAPATTTIKPDRMIIRNNITIRKSEKIIDENIPGHVDEVVIKSTSNFSIELSIDDHQLLHESMADLIDMSEDIVSIVAIYSGGIYRFSITDLTYNKLFMRVFLSGSGTFNIFRKLRRDPHAD
jgi:hypothetical protein